MPTRLISQHKEGSENEYIRNEEYHGSPGESREPQPHADKYEQQDLQDYSG
jgi:hypothetical protein